MRYIIDFLPPKPDDSAEEGPYASETTKFSVGK